MDEIVFPSLNYGLSDIMKSEHPELLDRLRTSAFTTLADVFYDAVPDDNRDYISMLGLPITSMRPTPRTSSITSRRRRRTRSSLRSGW